MSFLRTKNPLLATLFASTALAIAIASPIDASARTRNTSKTKRSTSSSPDRIAVTAPIERSELKAPTLYREYSRYSVGMHADYWNVSLPTLGSPTQLLWGLEGRIPFWDSQIGPFSAVVGAHYTRFSRERFIQAGTYAASQKQSVHWAGGNLGAQVDLLGLQPIPEITPALSLVLAPAMLSASESVAGPSLSQFEMPLLAGASVSFLPMLDSPVLIEARAFYSSSPWRKASASGFGVGAGLQYSFNPISQSNLNRGEL